MGKKIKLILLTTVSTAVFLGFFKTNTGFGFSILNVFLFNLTAGGTLLTVRLRGKDDLDAHGFLFWSIAVLFSIGAAAHLAAVCIAAALILGIMVENIRWRRFAWFPSDFFKSVPASMKFEQASLLCLSCGLFICAATMANNEYLKLINYEKLGLHVFFLGFSFPISLILFSELFRRIENRWSRSSKLVMQICFWGLNLGVIFFFIFIILEIYFMQMAMALTLFSVTCITGYLSIFKTDRDDHREILTSALLFLAVGSITGIIYICLLWKGLAESIPNNFLSYHSAATVFGWNFAWFLPTTRFNEFPLKIKTKYVIALHWIFVLLIPLGRVYFLIGVFDTFLCIALLTSVFFISTNKKI